MRLDANFLASTRGRIVDLLRRAGRTVEELARELGVTDNAVRPHLAALERDGIIRATGVRREGTVGKPATMYEIDPAAEPDFSQAYLPLLTALLTALGDRMDERELRALMRDVGHRLSGDAPPDRGALRARVEAASRVLNELGGVTTVEEDEDGALYIQGCGCPLSAAVSERSEVCLAVQTMLSDLVGVPVRERCNRASRVQCRFEIRRLA
jgi:predicted ArsR family transcriptional regulator